MTDTPQPVRSRYFVWRRNDGYINATAGGWPRDYPAGYGSPEVTFEHLGEFTEWPDAFNFIKSMERS